MKMKLLDVGKQLTQVCFGKDALPCYLSSLHSSKLIAKLVMLR
jgi:hypothetical protein